MNVQSDDETSKHPEDMDQIEPDALYDERADVSRARPLLQGDVFDDVVLHGFGEEPRKVQIVAHPCAMRTGATLTPRITVAPVEPYQLVTGRDGKATLGSCRSRSSSRVSTSPPNSSTSPPARPSC